MTTKKSFSIIKVLGWLVLVLIFFILIRPSYTDYTVRAKVSEAISLAYGAEREVITFYETYQHFPTVKDILDITNYKGKYVEQVYFAEIVGSDFFYIISKIKTDADNRIKDKSIVLVIEPVSKWQYKVTCETNLDESLDGCSK